EPQGVDGLAAVTDHRAVVGNTDQGRGLIADYAQAAAPQLEATADGELHRLLRARHFPRVCPAQPVVRLLLLPAVPHRLLEAALLVARSEERRVGKECRCRGTRW